jgi:hypothetical protein
VVNSAGNLGLGVTPSAWDSGFKAIDVAAMSTFTGSATGTDVWNNTRVTGGAAIYKTTAAASFYRQFTGQHVWYTAPSGTAGNAITFTQAMTLDASGNLLVGATTASYSASGRSVTVLGGSASGLLGFQIGGVAKGYVGHFDTSMQVWNEAASPILFGTSATERARIDSSGNLLVGTTTSAGKVTFAGSGAASQTLTLNGTTTGANYARFTSTGADGVIGVENSAGSIILSGSSANATVLYTVGATSLQFGTNSITRATIDSTGNVGIGTKAPIAKFEVSGSSGQLFSVVDSMVGTFFSVNDVSGIPSIEVLDTGLIKLAQYTGQVAISTSTAQSGFALTTWGNMYVNSSTYIVNSLGVGTGPSGVAGEIRAANEITAYYTSDERLKENVVLIGNPIEKLMQIRGVSFDWTEEHIISKGGEDSYFVRKHDIGVIAQEIEKVLPEIVATRNNGYKAVKYEKIVPLLIECIKEQQTQINQILARLEMLNIK